MLRIVLGEYESVDLDLTRVQAEALARTGFVEIGPAPGGRWRLRAGSHVGTLAIDGLHLLIRPKIRPENLFLLLEPGLPPHAWRQE
ncbi:MAG: restriction endonuclease, partial [Microbacteriaceae bacterium]|nr:restriction endonuclease [Microbacteriaceae bacterium]